jgi:hypothetical protein
MIDKPESRNPFPAPEPLLNHGLNNFKNIVPKLSLGTIFWGNLFGYSRLTHLNFLNQNSFWSRPLLIRVCGIFCCLPLEKNLKT